MSTEQQARILKDILARLDVLEVRSHISFGKGTYVPTYVGGTSAGTTTYTAQSGIWYRLGKIVFVTGQVAWSAATGTGNARVSLPTASATGYSFSGSLRLQNVTFANSAPEMRVPSAVAYFEMDSPLTNAAPTAVAVEAAGNIIFTCFYFVD